MKGVLVLFYYKNLDKKEYYKLENINIPDTSLPHPRITVTSIDPKEVDQFHLGEDITFVPMNENDIEKIINKDSDIINKISEYVKDEFNSKQKHKLEYESSEPAINKLENVRMCSPCGGGCSSCSACSACSRAFSK